MALHHEITFEPDYSPGANPLTGRALQQSGGPVDLIVVRDWDTRVAMGEVEPDENGEWSLDVPPGQYEVTAISAGCQPYSHGPYTVDPPA